MIDQKQPFKSKYFNNIYIYIILYSFNWTLKTIKYNINFIKKVAENS